MTSVLESEPPSGAEPPDPLRILYLANGFPWPLTSGYLRHYFLIRELARRGHRISLLTIVPSGFEPTDRAELEPFTERIVTVDSHRRTRSFRRRAQRRLESASIGESAARRLRDEVETVVAHGPPRRGPVQWSSDLPGPRGGDRDADRGRRVRRHVEPDPRQPALRLDRAVAAPPGRVHRGQPGRAGPRPRLGPVPVRERPRPGRAPPAGGPRSGHDPAQRRGPRLLAPPGRRATRSRRDRLHRRHGLPAEHRCRPVPHQGGPAPRPAPRSRPPTCRSSGATPPTV